MANSATIKINATVLPDAIAKSINNMSVSYQPADATEGWYYQLSKIDATSRDLISDAFFLQQGNTTASAATATGSSPVSITAANDKIKFLLIRNKALEYDGTSNTTDSVYLTLDAGAAAHNAVDAIEIGPGECWFGKINAPVTSVHVICGQKDKAAVSSKTLQAEVYAIIDDI